jgi:hypothetical protein
LFVLAVLFLTACRSVVCLFFFAIMLDAMDSF